MFACVWIHIQVYVHLCMLHVGARGWHLVSSVPLCFILWGSVADQELADSASSSSLFALSISCAPLQSPGIKVELPLCQAFDVGAGQLSPHLHAWVASSWCTEPFSQPRKWNFSHIETGGLQSPAFSSRDPSLAWVGTCTHLPPHSLIHTLPPSKIHAKNVGG